MSEEFPGAINKGARVFARRLGKADVRGKITWVGPNRYGEGYRYGVRADDGTTHWVDEKDITPEVDPSAEDKGGIKKGSQVVVTGGPHSGVRGEVFIASPGGRFGVRDDDEETYWVDEKDIALD